MAISDHPDFRALDPFFRIIEEGVAGLVDGEVLEHASEGQVVATAAPYTNRYISVLTITDRAITHWRDYLHPIAAHELGSLGEGAQTRAPRQPGVWRPAG